MVCDLARAGGVKLAIYDLMGREVRRIERTGLAAGRWNLEWDGRDADGARLPSGLYFYRVGWDDGTAATGRLVRTR